MTDHAPTPSGTLDPELQARLRALLRLTDQLRSHALAGEYPEADAVHATREQLLHLLFEQPLVGAARQVLVETACAVLDADSALTACLESGRARLMDELAELRQRRRAGAGYSDSASTLRR